MNMLLATLPDKPELYQVDLASFRRKGTAQRRLERPDTLKGSSSD
ncbi:hypothetical protein [Pseudomonas koreensis]